MREKALLRPCVLRSPFAPIVLPLVALIAGVIRWLAQGTGNVYTAMKQRFFVPDPVFDWRESSQHPLWLGLEALAVIAGVVLALGVAALWIRRRERKAAGSGRVLRVLAWVASPLPLIIPIAAFASGPGPEHGRLTVPSDATAAAPTEGIEGKLALPAGRYEVFAHPDGTYVSARVKAGGDEFDARFAGDPQGFWQAEPADFTRPMSAELSVAAASVDTGIELRSEHARGEYLHASEHPRIGFTLKRLIAARQDNPAQVSFRGAGAIDLAGKQTEVELTGSMQVLEEAKKPPGLAGKAVVKVKAQLVLPLAQTALKVGDYDTDKFPILVSLVLVHREASK
jgi:hypothetical protein